MSDSPATDLPPLDQCGFMRVPMADPPKGGLWMTCEQCGKSDHFWREGSTIRCRCGARYGHAVRPDGSEVPAAEVEPVPFDKGPASLATWEWDPVRLGLVVVVGLALLGAVGWVVLSL